MAAGRILALALVAMAAMNIIALPMSLDSGEVQLIEENGVWGDLLKTAHADKAAEHRDLGENKGDIRDPPKVRNPYAQQVVDMEEQKQSMKTVKKASDKYRRLKYYSAGDAEKDALNNAVQKMQTLASQRRPNFSVNNLARAANHDLAQASLTRYVREMKAQKLDHYAVHKKELKAIADISVGKPSLTAGPFQRLYAKSTLLDKASRLAKASETSLKIPSLSEKTLKAIGGKSKNALKQRAEEDVYWAYENSKSDFNPKHSKKYKKAKHDIVTKVEKLRRLKQMGMMFKVAKLKNPSLTYKAFSLGTDVDGIPNFYAMKGDELTVHINKVKRLATTLASRERGLQSQHEKYLEQFTQNARMLPYAEWRKAQDIDRQVRSKVKDKNEVQESDIESDAKKMKARQDRSVSHAIAALNKAREQERLSYDKDLARALSAAPKKKDLKELEKEGILGAERLRKDTELANEKLRNETLYPAKYGPDRHKLASNKEASQLPDFKKVLKREQLKQKRELVKKAYAAEARDARNLAKSGSRTDLRLLRHDQNAALHGHLTAGPAERAIIGHEEKYYDRVRKQSGEETLEDVKAGIKARVAKEMKEWDQMKGALLAPPMPSIGKAALSSLPSGPNDPLMHNVEKRNFNGQTTRAAVPLTRNDPPMSDEEKPSQDEKDLERMSPHKEAAAAHAQQGRSTTKSDDAIDTADSVISKTESAEKAASAEAGKSDSKSGKQASKLSSSAIAVMAPSQL